MGFTLVTLQDDALPRLPFLLQQIECFHLFSGLQDHLPQLPCDIGNAKIYVKNPLFCNRLQIHLQKEIGSHEGQLLVFLCGAGFLLGFTFGGRIATMLGM